MHPKRGKPLGGRELRRLTTKGRRGRYVGVTTLHNGGGFEAVADVALSENRHRKGHAA